MTYRGIKTNNLKNIDVDLHKWRMTCIAGVSGSGKSSLAFSTIAKISQDEYDRMTNDNKVECDYDVDSYDDVLVAIPLKQLNFNVNPRSTIMSYFSVQKAIVCIVGSLSGIPAGDLDCNGEGRCRKCQGLGYQWQLDPNCVIECDARVREVPFKCWKTSHIDFFRQLLAAYCEVLGIDVSLRFGELSDGQQRALLYDIGRTKRTFKYRVGGRTRVKTSCYIGPMIGLEKRNDDLFCHNGGKFRTPKRCDSCGGSRLRPDIAARALVDGLTVGDFYQADIETLERKLLPLKQTVGKNLQPALATILSFASACRHVGLGYLSLTRSIVSLSGGELQRLRIAQLLVGKMRNLLIVLDEPTASLYPAEVDIIISIMGALRKKNTLLVVEHNEKVIDSSDHVIYLGAGGGKKGGYLIGKKAYGQSQQATLQYRFFQGTEYDTCVPTSDHVDYVGSVLAIPHTTLLGLCGRSGCGKTTILRDVLPKRYEHYLYVSQKPLKGNAFTTVATYTKVLDEIRNFFAQSLGKDKGCFSSRGKGACDKCGGLGSVEIGGFYEERLLNVCDRCNGSGYLREVLSWRVNGFNIHDIQQMTIDELLEAQLGISTKAIKTLMLLSDLGLGYLAIGQTVKTLSGGENQRIKLAEALSDNRYAIIGLDEPAKGLGRRETIRLLGLIYHQIEKNKKTFIIAEHNPAFLNYCSYFAELRREGRTSSIVFQGTREQLFRDRKNDIQNWLVRDVNTLM